MISNRHFATLKRLAIFASCLFSVSYFARSHGQQWVAQIVSPDGQASSWALFGLGLGKSDNGIRLGSSTLVSAPNPEGRDLYNHSIPYDGTLMHYTTAFHPDKEVGATNYILESLWFLEAEDSYRPWAIQAFISGNWSRFSFECEYDGDTYGGMMYPQRGRDEYLRVECATPVWARKLLTTEATDEERHEAMVQLSKSNIAINVWIWLDDEQQVDDTALVVESEEGEEKGRRMRLARHEFDKWVTPATSNTLSICTAPVRFSDQTTVTDIIEWRVFHLHQGFTAVHWYSRDPALESLVHTINAALHTSDTYQLAPISVPHYAHQATIFRGYADQSAWQADCLLRWGHEDTWQGHFDIDEYLIVKDEPHQTALLERLEELQPNVATVSVFQVYFGGSRIEDAPKDESYPDFPRDAFTNWQPEHRLGGARYTKALHRTSGTESVWVHSALGVGPGFIGMTEEGPDTNLSGTMQFLHSRRYMYQDMEWPVENIITPEVRQHWEDLRAKLVAAKDLLKWSPEPLPPSTDVI